MPIEYYVEKEPSVGTDVKSTKTQSMGRYNMNANTLMFIASGGVRLAAIGRTFSNLPLGPCFNCSGPHWIQDCPTSKQNANKGYVMTIKPLDSYCEGCGTEHLIQNCLMKPKEIKGRPL